MRKLQYMSNVSKAELCRGEYEASLPTHSSLACVQWGGMRIVIFSLKKVLACGFGRSEKRSNAAFRKAAMQQEEKEGRTNL